MSSTEDKEISGNVRKEKDTDDRSDEKETTGHLDEGQDTAALCEGLVELLVLPYQGEDVCYDEERNRYTLEKRKKPLVCQRSASPPHESSPAGSLPASDVNQVASCPTEEQLLSSSQQPPPSSTEGQIPDAVDEAPINIVLSKVSDSGNEKQSVSNKCQTTDNAEKSSSNMADYKSCDQLQDRSPNDQMSPSMSNEQSPTSYDWQYSNPAEESSPNVPYYEKPIPADQLEPHHTGIQTLESGDITLNTTAACQVSSSGLTNEQSPSSNECQYSEPVKQSSSKVPYYQLPNAADQLQPHITGIQCLETGDKMQNTTADFQVSSSGLTDEESSTSNECQYSNPVKQFSSNLPYSQSQSPADQLQPSHSGIQSLGTGEKPNTTTACQVCCNAEQPLSSSTTGQYFHPANQQPPSLTVWIPPNYSANEPYTYSQWVSDISNQRVLRTAVDQPVIYTAQHPYTFPECNCQLPILNFRGRQVLWSRSNVQREMYYPQQVPSPTAALPTYCYLTAYQHIVTPGCCPPTPPLLSPISTICLCPQCQAASPQNPQVLNPVYYTEFPPAYNQVFYNGQWQVGGTPAPVYVLQHPAIFSGTVPQAPSQQPPQEWSREQWSQQECKNAGSSESYALEINKEHSSSEETSHVSPSLPSSEGEVQPENEVETGNDSGREENGGEDLKAVVMVVQETRQRDEREFDDPENVYTKEVENSQHLERDQHQRENSVDKKSRRKRYRHRKRQPETPPVERQQIPIWKKSKRDRAQGSPEATQPQAAGCSDGATGRKKRGRGRRQRVQYCVQDMLTLTADARDQEGPRPGPGPEEIQLGGPTPQESARRRRRRHDSESLHADDDVDETRLPSGERCTHCMATAPPSRLCYRCCCLGAARRFRQGNKRSEPGPGTQPLPSGSQTVSVEVTVEISNQKDAKATAETNHAPDT